MNSIEKFIVESSIDKIADLEEILKIAEQKNKSHSIAVLKIAILETSKILAGYKDKR